MFDISPYHGSLKQVPYQQPRLYRAPGRPKVSLGGGHGGAVAGRGGHRRGPGSIEAFGAAQVRIDHILLYARQTDRWIDRYTHLDKAVGIVHEFSRK